jgi:hypothetical protein
VPLGSPWARDTRMTSLLIWIRTWEAFLQIQFNPKATTSIFKISVQNSNPFRSLFFDSLFLNSKSIFKSNPNKLQSLITDPTTTTTNAVVLNSNSPEMEHTEFNGGGKNADSTTQCVRVAVNIRPLISTELLHGCTNCITVPPGEPQVHFCIWIIFFRIAFVNCYLLAVINCSISIFLSLGFSLCDF